MNKEKITILKVHKLDLSHVLGSVHGHYMCLANKKDLKILKDHKVRSVKFMRKKLVPKKIKFKKNKMNNRKKSKMKLKKTR